MVHFDVPDIVVTVLAYFHVISAISWLGAALLFTSTIAPSTRRLSPGARLEFLATSGPRLRQYFFVSATSTVVFGIALFLTIPDFSPYLYIGIASAAATYILVLTELPLFIRLETRANQLLKEGLATDPLPADFREAARRGGITTVATVVLLAFTLIFMVYSGFGP